MSMAVQVFDAMGAVTQKMQRSVVNLEKVCTIPGMLLGRSLCSTYTSPALTKLEDSLAATSLATFITDVSDL